MSDCTRASRRTTVLLNWNDSVSRDQFWIATTLAILAMLLLELKEFLENLATTIPGDEIFTFTKFLLLTCVILPIVPNQDFTSFALNPYKTWLIVVAISGVSYGSYLLEIPYSDDRELVMDILKHGPEVEVLAPQKLRERVVEALREAAGLYAPAPKEPQWPHRGVIKRLV